MLRRKSSVSTWIVLSLYVVGGLTSSAFGQVKTNKAIETLHPAKPAVLVVWDGLAVHQKSWDATAAKQALLDSGFSAQINNLLNYAAVEAGEPVAKLAHKLFLQALDKGASISVTVAEIDGSHAPQFTLIFHGSASLERELSKVLAAGPFNQLEPKTEMVKGRKVTRVTIPEIRDFEAGWWVDGGHLVIAGGVRGIEAALDVGQGKAANLSTNLAVKKLRTTDEFDVAFVGLIDAKSLLDLVRDIPLPHFGSEKVPTKPVSKPTGREDDRKPAIKAPEAKEEPKVEAKEEVKESDKDKCQDPSDEKETGSVAGQSESGPTIGDLLKIAGIDRVGLITTRSGFKGEAIVSEMTVEAPAPLTGLLTLFDQEPITLADMPAIPANCDQFVLMRLDASKLCDAVAKMLQDGSAKLGDTGFEELDRLSVEINRELGINLKSDLFDPLGDTVAFYLEGGIIAPQGTLLIKLDDADKIRESLEVLETKMTEAARNESRGFIHFRTKELAGGRALHFTQLGPQALFSVAWTVEGEWLVIGTTSHAVEAYLRRIDGALPKWTPAPDLIAAQKSLPDKFVSLTYSDPRGGMQTLLGWTPTIVSMIEMEIKDRRRWGYYDAKPAYVRRDKESDEERIARERKERLEREARREALQREVARQPFAFPIKPEDIPLTTDVTGPLFPNVGVCTVDSAGIHWYSRISIPSLMIPIPNGGAK